jgi:hypothetical protein
VLPEFNVSPLVLKSQVCADNDVIRVYGDELPEKGIVKLYELKNR